MVDAEPTHVDDGMVKDRLAAAGKDGGDAQLVRQLVEQARRVGLQFTGEGGLLWQLTERVL
ncbi:hypothetical protein AB0H89_20965 [Catellatospora methionotrophica]